MRKTTTEIDEELYERVRDALGTTGLKATVHEAFREVLVQRAREEVIRQMRTMDGLDLDKPEVMDRAWR